MPYVEKLKMIKDEKGLSLAEIAKIADIPLPTITRVFNGQTPNPTFETISRISFALGVSLDKISGLKQPDESPIASPIENTLNSYSELLKEKDDRIQELQKEKEQERNERRRLTGVLVVLVTLVLIVLAVDLLNGDIGHIRY